MRLFPNDFHQAAALAQVAAALELHRLAVLHDGAPYGLALAEGFRRAAGVADLSVSSYQAWQGIHSRPKQTAWCCAAYPTGSYRFPGFASRGVRWVCRDRTATGRQMIALAPGVRPGLLPDAAEEFAPVLASGSSPTRYYRAVLAPRCGGAFTSDGRSRGRSRLGVVQRLFDGEPRSGRLGRIRCARQATSSGRSPILGFTVFRAANEGSRPKCGHAEATPGQRHFRLDRKMENRVDPPARLAAAALARHIRPVMIPCHPAPAQGTLRHGLRRQR